MGCHGGGVVQEFGASGGDICGKWIGRALAQAGLWAV